MAISATSDMTDRFDVIPTKPKWKQRFIRLNDPTFNTILFWGCFPVLLSLLSLVTITYSSDSSQIFVGAVYSRPFWSHVLGVKRSTTCKRAQQVPTLSGQQFWELLRPFARSLSNCDGDVNENDKTAIGLDWQNNYFARASRLLVHFFVVTARLFFFYGGRKQETTNFTLSF